MTKELEDNIIVMVKQGGGRLEQSLRPEFKKLCQEELSYNPDMECGKCIYKHAVKLYNKYINESKID